MNEDEITTYCIVEQSSGGVVLFVGHAGSLMRKFGTYANEANAMRALNLKETNLKSITTEEFFSLLREQRAKRKRTTFRPQITPINARDQYYMYTYGISENDYKEMFKQQNGTCAICKRPSKNILVVDHCHKTGKVRGLLCSACNARIGHIEGKIQIYRACFAYLKKYSQGDDLD